MFHVKHGIVACEANGICADAARAHKRVYTCGFHPLVNHPFPIIARRKSESGDRFEIGERQSGYRSVYFVKYSQFTDSVLLHRPATSSRRDTR